MQIFRGRVVSGLGVGKKFGIPTLNLQFDVMPDLAYGVYACRASEKRFPALLHYGPRPTIADEELSFEVFFLEFPEGAQFQTLEVEVLGKIRDVQKFDSLEALSAQVERDKKKAMVEYFGHASPAPRDDLASQSDSSVLS